MTEARIILCILDGWGISGNDEHNAIRLGETPVLDRLTSEYPFATIEASGEMVGLPKGQMGNSEVGHLNIGAGRVVYQDLLRISNAIEDGSFFKNSVLLDAVNNAKRKSCALHLIGLVSDGGVHSHIDHISALLELAKQKGLRKVYIHALLDGRDTPPDSGYHYIEHLENEIKKAGFGKIATIQGRFFAMDRDKRWDRVARGYNILTSGMGQRYSSALAAIKASYEAGVMDEFVEPCLIANVDGEPEGILKDDDEVIMFNFRADRMREIVRALSDPAFSDFKRELAPRVNLTCLTEYNPNFELPIAYETNVPQRGLAEILSKNGVTQLRTAETEKYAHVTFFFNGGVEQSFKGESRKLVSSPRVRTYDEKPQMSCPEVTDNVVSAIESKDYQVIIVNIANGDMVGHTGIWPAALEAVKVVDSQVGRIVAASKKAGAHLMITADHGNIELMVDKNGKPHTQHTTNPVPFHYIADDNLKLRDGGHLADIAPTILALLGLEKPDEMTGKSLLV